MRRSEWTKAQRVLFAAAASSSVLACFGIFGGIGFVGGSVAAGQYQYGKVTICHNAGKQRVTITVAAAAVPAHVRQHGDTVGPCP